MKTKTIVLAVLTTIGFSFSYGQIKLGDKLLGAAQKGIVGITFSDSDAVKLAREAIEKMDKESVVASNNDPYTLRLNKIFAKHKNENGLVLNYKVYKIKEVNAFAAADGSVRVYSGLMDIMDDNELLAVIGHEIGHVVNHDSRDAIKAAYLKESVLDIAASQEEKVTIFTESQLGKIGNTLIESKHSRKQESEADLYSYDFMKRNGYNVNAVESAFMILAKNSEGSNSNFFTKMMSSHPDAKDRAELAKKRAMADGLYKVYVKQISVKKGVKKKAAVKKR